MLKVGDVLYYNDLRSDQLWAVTEVDDVAIGNLIFLTVIDVLSPYLSRIDPAGNTFSIPAHYPFASVFTIIGNVYDTTTANSIETNKCKCDLSSLMNIGCKCGGI